VGSALLAGALTTTGAVVALGGVAQAENPPLGPGNIEIFNHRDMVALEGYVDQAGEKATVTVKRGGQVIGIGEGTVDATGFLEFNHPGGECWIGVTPNIKGGDLVEVSFSESAFVDGATVGSAVITSVTHSAVTATPDVDGDIEGTVTITGTYGADVSLDRFVVEVVNPEMRRPDPGAPPTSIGERAIGWTPVVDPAEPNGGPGFTVDGSAADGAFSVTFGLQSEADQQRVLDGEHVVMTWLADAAPDLALGATQYEFGESDGPGFGGCPAGPGTQPPLPPTSAELTAGDDSITIDWDAPAQAPDAPEISEYRVAAVDAVLGQEVAVRTATTDATIEALAAQSYELTMEAFNGHMWSPVQPLGTVDLATGEVLPANGGTVGGGTTDPGDGGAGDPGSEDPAAAPAAPANVATNVTGLSTMDVSWAASAGATSYEVSVSTDAVGALVPAPVTVAAPATSASVTGLTPGTAYTVSVTAANAAGAGTAATASATTPATAAPGAARVTRVLSAHEAATLEWQAAAPGNAFSPVTGYDLVATPVPGTTNTAARPVTVTVGAVTNGTVTGLRNGVTYGLEVFARTGDLRGAVGVFATGVATTVVPNDQVTVTRADYRSDKREYRIQGSAQDTTQNTVTVRTSAGALIAANVPVAADGTWSLNLRNGPALPTNNRITVTSTSGASLTTAVTRSR
jgi:hypothetical protein